MLVYLAAGLAGAVLLRPSSIPALLLGIWAAIAVVSTYGLATRLFPDQLGVYNSVSGNRLSDPVGYWNVLRDSRRHGQDSGVFDPGISSKARRLRPARA